MSKARGLADLGNAFDDGALSNRNIIINGAMQVAQRGTSVTGTSCSGYHTVDRWKQISDGGAGTLTLSVASDAPAGFSSSEKIEYTVGGSKLTSLTSYLFEGQDLQRLGFGTSSANPVTLSFWVKSNVTGTYTAELYATSVRQVSKTYSVNTSGVWEYKELTFPADTNNGFANNNALAMYLFFWRQAGSTFTSGTQNTSAWSAAVNANRINSDIPAFSASAGNYFQITGVQLEVGDTATPFEHRSYGDELARCQRYYYRRTSVGSNGNYYRYVTGFHSSTSSAEGVLEMPVEMRATPSLSSAGTFAAWDSVGVRNATTVTIGGDGSSRQTINLNVSGISGGTQFRPVEILSSANASSYLELSAEL